MTSNPNTYLKKLPAAVTLLSQAIGHDYKSSHGPSRLLLPHCLQALDAIDELGFSVINERAKFGGEKTYHRIRTFDQWFPNISLPPYRELLGWELT
jgi:hypothetical protein